MSGTATAPVSEPFNGRRGTSRRARRGRAASYDFERLMREFNMFDQEQGRERWFFPRGGRDREVFDRNSLSGTLHVIGFQYHIRKFCWMRCSHGGLAEMIESDDSAFGGGDRPQVARRIVCRRRNRHCPMAESPRRDIGPEPLQRGRHVARRRRDTSHARPYHMRARMRRPSNSQS